MWLTIPMPAAYVPPVAWNEGAMNGAPEPGGWLKE
jgi:hypothetical protein